MASFFEEICTFMPNKIDILINILRALCMMIQGFEHLFANVQSSKLAIPSPTTSLPFLSPQLKEPQVNLFNKFNGAQSKF